ncbi:MAG: bifunctional phosphoribosylaminoimidazolecarboxamide formyltransferase/IMP cyclohydrolase [Muribaculaceae bacterium]|nr:bifunctional phosphoribosylaminoimidazolecarboxamide formyltransferase/IMP cyclohydrolase [Muribaculaceae bacterium]
MSGNIRKIKRALISVYHKDGLDEILHLLQKEGVELLSTGGTQKFIENLGIPCRKVEDLTGYPSIFGGRVKTLHPKVMGGILQRREDLLDREERNIYDIPEIDLVIVDLYPFRETVAAGGSESDIIEKIDIGGITLIRAAAKNYKDVVIIPSKSQYSKLLDILKSNGAQTSIEERRDLACDAFGVSSGYDSAIFNYFVKTECREGDFRAAFDGVKSLRYGENPHQKGSFVGAFDDILTQLHGKEISYNNLLDIDAAVSLISDFVCEEPTVAILKHNNACGIATRSDLKTAWEDALAGDPVSAFGGIIISNKAIDAVTANEIDKIFFEVIIAPSYSDDALEILKHKKNRIILILKDSYKPCEEQFRSCLNGVLVQDKDLQTEKVEDLKVVTKKPLSESEVKDLLFANKIVKHSKSNAIVLAKNLQLLASGVGQTSRVDALKQAIEKAKGFGFDLTGAVMASDAFFPFPDCVEIAGDAGITAVVHPGGSMRDQESIDKCDEKNMGMGMTGFRHFKH